MTGGVGSILVGTDFSAHADHAVERAIQLALEHRVAMHVVHALDGGDWVARAVRLTHGHFSEELLRRAAGSRLARLRERILAAGVTEVETEILGGPLHQGLADLIHEHPEGLLAMGDRGEGSLREGLLGSTADRVLRAGVCPVLLCRGAPRPWRNVALATDFSPASAGAARLGLALAPQASFYLLHACELVIDRGLAFANATAQTRLAYEQEAWTDASRQLEAFAAALGHEGAALTRAPRRGPPGAVLSSFVAEAAIDLVVLGARPRARWEANLLGSTALFASNRLGCDVLLVPEKT
jgi:nucleotide-binding universal stress UspA family protein